MSRIVILGIGNELKGDDGIGPIIAKKFKQDSNLLSISTDVPENWIQKIIDFSPDILIIIDCADFQGKPGDIKIIPKNKIMDFSLSTHTLSIPAIVSAVLSKISCKIFLIGVQPRQRFFNTGITREVKKAVPNILKTIKELIENNQKIKR